MDGDRGLSTAEVERRRRRDGPNELPTPSGPRPLALLGRQLTHLLAILLWVACGLALLARMPPLAAAIAVIVVLNALFAFWQEFRADRSTQQLRALLPTGTRILRDGAPRTVPVRDLAVGDVVLLAAGDRVGADMRVLVADSLSLDESLTTDESGAGTVQTCWRRRQVSSASCGHALDLSVSGHQSSRTLGPPWHRLPP